MYGVRWEIILERFKDLLFSFAYVVIFDITCKKKRYWFLKQYFNLQKPE